MSKFLRKKVSEHKKSDTAKKSKPDTTETPDFGIPEEWEHLREKALKRRVRVYAGY